PVPTRQAAEDAARSLQANHPTRRFQATPLATCGHSTDHAPCYDRRVSGLDAGAVVDGKYRIVRTLGEGGMGVVYVAEHSFLQKHFALKLLRPELAGNAELAARFEQEARATSLIEHENIVRVTDFGRTPSGELY